MSYAAHGASPSRSRRPDRTTAPARTATALAVAAGLLYGFWAAFVQRDAGAFSFSNLVLGVVLAVIAAAVIIALHRIGPALLPEVRAGAWAAAAGIAAGFLYSLTDASVLRSVTIGLLIAAPVLIGTLYRFRVLARRG